ncbi:hypothetical protein NL676_013772 [Syzygium grande]|nr:hypothetical protein NL676_013772 [Syzygium grande]
MSRSRGVSNTGTIPVTRTHLISTVESCETYVGIHRLSGSDQLFTYFRAPSAGIKTRAKTKDTERLSAAVISQFPHLSVAVSTTACTQSVKVFLGLLKVARNERTPQVCLSLPCSRPRVLSRASCTSTSTVLRCRPPPRKEMGFLEGCLAALCCCCLIDECCCDPSIFFVC